MKEVREIFPAWMSAEGQDQDVVLFTRLSLNRNSEEFLFPHIMDHAALPDFLSRGDAVAKKLYSRPTNHDLSGKNTKLLIEQLYITSEMQGMGRHLNLSPDGNSALLLNGEDHFSLMEINPGFTPWEQLKVLEQRDEILEKHFTYAVSMDMGYLLSRIDRVGSGFHVDVCLHLPVLSIRDHFTKIVARAQRNNVTMSSFGDHHTPLGQLFLLSTDAILGTDERQSLEKLIPIVQEFIHAEREERNSMRESIGIEFIDKLWRNFAALQNSRVLSLRESINRLSTVRVGGCLGILPLTPPPLLFFASQPAHLQHLASMPIFADLTDSEKENEQLRATLFRRLLKTAPETTD